MRRIGYKKEEMKNTIKTWVEDQDLIRHSVDNAVVERMLVRSGAAGLDRRGILRDTQQRVSYDREGRYPLGAKVYPRADGSALIVAAEDLFRPGDLIYVEVRGNPQVFLVSAVRPGSRLGDCPRTRVLTVRPR